MGNKRRYPSSQRVCLAPLDDSHISRYMQLSDDPELVRTMGWRPFGVEEKERFLQSIEVLTLPYCGSGRPIALSIIGAEEGKPIGYVCLKGINENSSSAELGIAIMERGYRGQGYGTEALKLAVGYAFDRLRLRLIGLTVFPFNERAIKAYEKVGFRRREALKKSWLLDSGEYADMLLMEVTRDQWMAVTPMPRQPLWKTEPRKGGGQWR